jgi:hypothetical protein
MKFFRILLFFPSITFSLLSAEIFPWSLFYSVIEKFKRYKKVDKRILPIFIIIFISLIYSIYVTISTNCDNDIFRSLIAYFNALFIYSVILSCSEKELYRLCKILEKVLFFFVILGILQSLGIINFLRPLFKFLTPRASSSALSEISAVAGGRGITLLSAEPARAAYEVIVLYAAWIYLNAFSNKFQIIFDIIISFFIFFIFRSSEGSILLFVYLFAKYKIKFIIAAIIVIISLTPILLSFNSRAIILLYHIFTNFNLIDVYYLLLNQSGFRLISLIAAYKYAIFHPLGGGLGLWIHSSVNALYETHIDVHFVPYFSQGYIPIRPISFVSSIALDFGITGILLVIYLLKPLFSLLKKPKDPIFCFICLTIFAVFFSGSIGDPIPWICMAICYRIHKINKHNNISSIHL